MTPCLTPSRLIRAAALATTLAALPALAHDNVQNAEVKARMHLMEEIRDATATLGGMAQGKTPFDAATAEEARAALAEKAAEVPDAFRSRAQDPRSEALDAIWNDFDDFTEKAQNLQVAAEELDPTTLDSLQAGMASVGRTCGACHQDYRMD